MLYNSPLLYNYSRTKQKLTKSVEFGKVNKCQNNSGSGAILLNLLTQSLLLRGLSLVKAGMAIDLGNLDLWAEGLPVSPAIATMPSLGGVWDEPMSAHTIPGSMGKAQNDTNRNSGLIPATV